MNNSKPTWAMRLWRAPMLSPTGFVVRAFLILGLFGLCHLLGWREHTTFLSGTSAAPGTSVGTSALLGVIYMAAYYGAVLATPILLLAAGILAGWKRLGSDRTNSLNKANGTAPSL